MRSLLEFLDRHEKYDLINNITKQFYNLVPSDDDINKDKAERLLKEFREKVDDSIIQSEINLKEERKRVIAQKKISEERRFYKDRILKIKNEFIEMHSSADKQKRGYAVEKLFFDILSMEEFEYKAPYKGNGEQIDGYFKCDKFDYLVEVKWTEKVSDQPALSIFDGKIKGKAQSTRGFFLSINGFSNNAIVKFSGDSPRIIFMDGQDLMLILEERVTFFDLMKLKIDHFVRKGDTYVNYNVAII